MVFSTGFFIFFPCKNSSLLFKKDKKGQKIFNFYWQFRIKDLKFNSCVGISSEFVAGESNSNSLSSKLFSLSKFVNFPLFL